MMRIIFVVFNRMGITARFGKWSFVCSMLLGASRIILQLIFAYSQNAAHGAKVV